MRRTEVLVCVSSIFVCLAFAGVASAEDPRVHIAAGGAHALGGSQSSEFGVGGAGAGSIELPATARLGIQATAGALFLSKGDAPKDKTIAETGAGSAFLGTLGLRLRAYDNTRVAGPWMDSNVGLAHTGDLARPAFDAHLGWDVRIARTSRLDVGPFVGYTQIFQPDSALRGSDARILTAGLSVSIGAKERARPAEPPSAEEPIRQEPPLEVSEVIEEDGIAEAVDTCKDGEAAGEDGCGDGVRLFEDRILLDDVVHFEFDKSRIRPQSHALVRKIAAFIESHADIVDISIEGHADEVGTEEYNQRLSEARARSMRDMLVQFGVTSSRLRTIAHGKSMPKIVTLKPEAKNRRVEMFVTRERERAHGQTPTQDSGNVSHGKSSK